MTQTLSHVIIVVSKSSILSSELRTLISGKLTGVQRAVASILLLSSFYNKTEYSGLETHILNSYTNAILQVMHYSLPIRYVAKSHITTNCSREHCRIQTFHRFLIEHMSQEGNTFPHNPIINTSVDDSRPPAAPVTQLFGIDGRNLITCLDCNATREKEMMTHVIDLTYLRKASFQDSFRWWLSNTDCGSQTLMSPNPLWISRQFCAIHYSVILHTKRHVKFANNLPRSPRVAQFPPKIFHLYWR